MTKADKISAWYDAQLNKLENRYRKKIGRTWEKVSVYSRRGNVLENELQEEIKKLRELRDKKRASVSRRKK